MLPDPGKESKDPKKEPNPLQELMTQCAEILNVLYTEQGHKPESDTVSKDIRECIDYMQQMNILLDNVYDEALKKTGITREELKKQLESGVEQLDIKSKTYITKIEQMKEDIERMRGLYKVRIEILEGQGGPAPLSGSKREENEISKSERRSVGMRRGWKKL